jgi:hypothetical protein
MLYEGKSYRIQEVAKMSYSYKDNSEEVLSLLDRAILRGFEAIGMEAEGFAKDDPSMPVDTGRARNSITYALSGEKPHIQSYSGDNGEEGGEYNGEADGKKGEAVFLGSNVSYFPTIELGGKNMTARHVLQRAATEHKERYKWLMENSIKNA